MKNEKGSLTLEAAMILPFFMLFIVFLANIIRIGIADMALYQSLAETNEVIVTHAYPAEIAVTGISDLAESKFSGLLEASGADQIGITPEIAADLFVEGMEYLGIEIDPHGYLNSFTASVIEPILREKFSEKTGGEFFDPAKLTVDQVVTPTSFTGSGAYLEINASYEVDINFPFVNRTIILKKTSYERLWAGA